MLVQDTKAPVRLLHEYLRSAAVLNVFVDILRDSRSISDRLYIDAAELHSNAALRMEVLPLSPRCREPSRFRSRSY